MNFIGFFNASKIRLMRRLLAAWICVLLIVCIPLPAFATVTQSEEYPGQMLYQSRQKLRDQNGNSWQAIAFKRIHPDGNSTVSLRVVGFSGAVEFDRTQPLILTTSMGETLTAKDISSEISKDTTTPATVAEYDIKSVLPQLQAEIPVRLTLPTIGGKAVSLSVPSSLVEEWQTVGSHE